jgi:pantoate--beta-alanine ligase
MLLFKQVLPLQQQLSVLKKEGKKIGFVPTMGALHQGHLSLIRYSMQETDFTVCSVFVNPTQFNDPADLKKYPKTPEKDIEMLLSTGCHLLFMPEAPEVYPPSKKQNLRIDFGYLDKSMEGAHRPGHFAGVAQVVHRLLDIVKPHRLYMGQKDFQQFSIVQHMLTELKSPVKLVVCPIVREADGLAMSSRNVLLNPAQRALAPAIYQTLLGAKKNMHAHFPRQIEADAMQQLSLHGMEPEYFSIVDGRTLQPVELFEETDFAVACTAVKVGNVRLIDNLILKED